MQYMHFAPLLLENLPLTPHFASPFGQFTLLNMNKYLPVISFWAQFFTCARGRPPSPALPSLHHCLRVTRVTVLLPLLSILLNLKLTRSFYFHLRCLRAIRKSVSSSTFTSIVHTFVCSWLDYCNSLLVGLRKVRLAPLQSVLSAAARLIASLPRFSHSSTFIAEQLHWLSLSLWSYTIQSSHFGP